MLLWTMVMTGAGVLLNSVIEEKSSRILEVLLPPPRCPQVMGGKILGVAAVTLTVLTVWLGIAAAALLSFAPAIAGDLASVLIGKGLVLYFAVFLVGGYLMYASLFVAIGAFCETVREAQTLLAPVMMLLTIPIVFMSQAIAQPDSPAVAALAWFPLFTPFLAPVRAAAEPAAVAGAGPGPAGGLRGGGEPVAVRPGVPGGGPVRRAGSPRGPSSPSSSARPRLIPPRWTPARESTTKPPAFEAGLHGGISDGGPGADRGHPRREARQGGLQRIATEEAFLPAGDVRHLPQDPGREARRRPRLQHHVGLLPVEPGRPAPPSSATL
ncbi:MAG: ABC transporter permease [Caulobacteraceae bacterium]